MTDRTLADADPEPAHVVGYGPVPGPVAPVWVRRDYTDPETGDLAGTDARRRDFPHFTRMFLTAPDQQCRSPVRSPDPARRPRPRDQQGRRNRPAQRQRTVSGLQPDQGHGGLGHPRRPRRHHRHHHPHRTPPRQPTTPTTRIRTLAPRGSPPSRSTSNGPTPAELGAAGGVSHLVLARGRRGIRRSPGRHCRSTRGVVDPVTPVFDCQVTFQFDVAAMGHFPVLPVRFLVDIHVYLWPQGGSAFQS